MGPLDQIEKAVWIEEHPCVEEKHQLEIVLSVYVKILLNSNTWDMGGTTKLTDERSTSNLRMVLYLEELSMIQLTGSQKKYLRGLAHGRKPVVLIGQKQLTPRVFKEIEQALDFHELIKVKCIDRKEKDAKKEVAETILKETGCELVGMIGHILIFFRRHSNPEKRKITLPAPAEPAGSRPPIRKDSAE